MSNWTAEELEALPSRYRGNLVNGILGFKPALLVGTASLEGETNLAVFSNVFHIGASPPLLGLIIRPSPQGTERHTLNNILATKAFTLNHINESMVPAAHQTSARYPRNRSEFSETGLTEDWFEKFAAPSVKEAPVKLGLLMIEHQVLAVNNTHLIIAGLQWLQCPESGIRSDGSVNLVDFDSQSACGLDSYHGAKPGQRFAYAKVDRSPQTQR
ncbi:MAG: flavin reductase [Luminiphilus sp.]|jgi:flavin reductase (DIM6/NTAB) family NADH-FMN oxidoreductase RutF|nr:flavin reductase [Luminiphilus sp.]MDG1461267.1 flavin reductase [Luminiphilus sp.]